MSAVKVAASTTMWATVMGSSGPATADTTYQGGTGDREDSSAGLWSSLGLERTGLGLCPCRKAAVGPLISPNISPAPALSLTPAWSLHLRPKGSPHHSKTSGHRGLIAEHRASLWRAPGGSGQQLWPEAQLSRLCRDEVSTYTHQPQPGYQGKEPSHVGPGGLPGGKGTTGRGRKGHRVRVRVL